MSNPEPILVQAANIEFNRWIDFLRQRPFTTEVVAEFVDEMEDAFEKIRDNPGRYPREGYSDYRKIGPTSKHRFKVIYTVRDGGDVDCGHCPSCPAFALLGATKAQALETQTLAGFLDGNRSRNAFFCPAHRLFQTHVQVFSRKGRTNRFGQVVDVPPDRGSQTLAGASGGKLGYPANDGAGQLDLIFRSKTKNQ